MNLGRDHQLLVADTGAGPTSVLGENTTLLAELPGVNDVALLSNGATMHALTTDPGVKSESILGITGEGLKPTLSALWRISNGRIAKIADLGAFEAQFDPDDDGVESNPFDLALMRGGRTAVADAAGNSILIVDSRGRIDWVAVLPELVLETRMLSEAEGCQGLESPDICGQGNGFAVDPVPTTVAIGPDGAIYAGELTGFPAIPGLSRIWRIEPGARHVMCGVDPECTLVDTGPFTSIIDLIFGPDGTAWVLELDEDGWLALEKGGGSGGTLNACDVDGLTWTCTEYATGLPLPTAVTVDGESVYVTLFALIPGEAQVVLLPSPLP
jgi:hypothetical protein